MTYAQFLLVILLPLVVLTASFLAFRLRRTASASRPALPRSITVLALALPLAALVYTTPWDSWLIRNSVWGYPPGTIIGTVFGVPLEEYTFMVGTTVLTGCWMLALAVHRTPGSAGGTAPAGPPPAADGRDTRRRVRAATVWLAAVVAGAVAATVEPRALYGGSQLAWFGVPLALQAAYGADVLRACWRLRLAGLATTPVLWVTDAVGIHAGAWHIGADSTVGLSLLGVLPLEEATFFLLVNLLIVNSVVLCLDPLMRRRLGRFSTGAAKSSTGAGAAKSSTGAGVAKSSTGAGVAKSSTGVGVARSTAAWLPDPHSVADRLPRTG